MNPREFFEEPGYPLALALTYSFDPVFFDRLPLRALWSGGSHEILVMADRREVERALDRVKGSIHHLGRRYVLAPVSSEGAFHPKLLLRLGREGAIAALGSGNLTHGGWGLNQEVATAWRVGPDLEDAGGWIPGLLEQALTWTKSPLAERTLGRIGELDWLESAPSRRVLFSGESTLGTQVRGLLEGRQFSRLRFVTGSTDESGALLHWFHEVFGIEEAVACITPRWSLWDPEKLAELPLAMSLVPQEAPLVHAKAYHLSGTDGDVLLVGSANCSPSAWLRSAEAGGNIEALLVYEDPEPGDLEFMDVLLAGDQHRPEELLTDSEGEDIEADDTSRGSPLVLDGLQLEADGEIVAWMNQAPENAWKYRAVLAEEEVELEVRGDLLVGYPSRGLPPGQTAFGYLLAEARDGRTVRTPKRWVDDLRMLQESTTARAVAQALGRLPKSSASEDDRLLQNLTRIAHDLIHDAQAIPDPFRGGGSSREPSEDSEGEANAPPVDPAALIQSLSEDPVPFAHPAYASHGAGLSFTGVFRALFGDTLETDEDHEVSLDEEEAAGSGREDAEDEPPEIAQPDPDPIHVQEGIRERFERQLDRFVEGLEKEGFRENCRANQMVQCIAFPFAVASLGLDRSWTSPAKARRWVDHAARLLLVGSDKDYPPLLDQVWKRYIEDGKEEVFRRTVGDGTLWVTMTAGLARVPWNGPNDALEGLLLIRRVWETELLRSFADQDHIELLVRRYHAGSAIDAIEKIAAPAAAALEVAEGRLGQRAQQLLERQKENQLPVSTGELLWGPKNGWAVVDHDEGEGRAGVYWPRRGEVVKMVLDGFFIRVHHAASDDEVLKEAHEQLAEVFERLIALGEQADQGG